MRKRLDPDAAAERVYNFLHTLTIEAQMMARACGKTNLQSWSRKIWPRLTMEAPPWPVFRWPAPTTRSALPITTIFEGD